jgi:hypothetical protein
MELMTTPVRQLTERLIQYSERQQVLLRALHEYTAALLADAAQGSNSGVAATADWVLESMSAPDIDVQAVPGSKLEQPACAAEPVSLEPVSADEVDLAGESSTLGCDEALPELSSYVAPGSAPVTSESSHDAMAAPTCEELDPVLVGGTQDGAPTSPAAQARPAPSAKVQSAGPPLRHRRDYNYFADLEVKLSELPKE